MSNKKKTAEPKFAQSPVSVKVAHDMVRAAVRGNVPGLKIKKKKQKAVFRAIQDVLCWVLGHPTQAIGRLLSDITECAARAGLVPDPDTGELVENKEVAEKVLQSALCNCPSCSIKRAIESGALPGGAFMGPGSLPEELKAVLAQAGLRAESMTIVGPFPQAKAAGEPVASPAGETASEEIAKQGFKPRTGEA